MKTKGKQILFYLTSFFFGFILSAVLTFSWLQSSVNNQIQIIRDHHIAYMINNSNMLYSVDDVNSVRINSITSLIEYLEELCNKKNDASYCEKPVYYDMTIQYVRLGSAYEKKGKLDIANDNYRKGFEIAKREGVFSKWMGTEKEIKTPDDLKIYVRKLDNDLKKN